MAKNIYICSREKLPFSVGEQLLKICKNLAPDNITPAEPMVLVNGDIAFGVMNPSKTLLVRGNSLLMGQIFDKGEKWDVPLQEFPDGSYALFRDGEEYCEIVTDPVASRTIWYYFDENVLIASTSQRAVVMFLGSFEFNENVIPWMLSTGTLGPAFSWDKRIKCVPVDSSVILDKKNWSISTKSNPIEFTVLKKSDEQHEKLLKESLRTTFKTLNLDYSNWVLPLSGGYDSRGILCLLLDASPNCNRLRTITWGLKSSLDIKRNDAMVASELASKLNVSNKYYANDLSEEPIEKIINRFVLLGEGRIDLLSDYMDGFKMWKTIFEDGIEGIIRGDEGFGCKPYSSPLAVRINQGCTLCTDISNLKDYIKYGFPLQELPPLLNQRDGETLCAWRDRLFHEHDLPTEFSALSDLKLSYVEQINPLLSKKILQQVRQLPDHLRTGKVLFKKIVNSLSPAIDYATSPSGAIPDEILKQQQIVNLIRNELSSDFAKTLFHSEFLDFVLTKLKSKDQIEPAKANTLSIRSSIRKIVPRFVKEGLRSKVLPPSLDNNILAFRVFLIYKMNKTLINECRA